MSVRAGDTEGRESKKTCMQVKNLDKKQMAQAYITHQPLQHNKQERNTTLSSKQKVKKPSATGIELSAFMAFALYGWINREIRQSPSVNVFENHTSMLIHENRHHKIAICTENLSTAYSLSGSYAIIYSCVNIFCYVHATIHACMIK